jgi:hypothetical protein
VLPFPFHFLNNYQAMNVRPMNYPWREFYDHVVDLSRYSFSWRLIARRFAATPAPIPRWMNLVRAMSSEGFGRIAYHTTIRELLDTDREVRDFMEGETQELPEFYAYRIRRELGPLFGLLPVGALMHDHTAYLRSEETGPLARAANAFVA